MRSGTLDFIGYLGESWVEIVNDAILHVDVTLLAVAIAVVIGVGIGVLTYQRPALASMATTVTGAFLTIPSLALLGILIGPLGLGLPNVLVALVLYGLLPITRNTIVGLRGVDPAVIEAGRGMGLGRARLLWRVRMPLAWPVILSGIRVSTQITIGIAAIGAYVKGYGLGNLIFDGLGNFGATRSLYEVIAGTLGIVVLALLFDLAFVGVGKLTTLRRRPAVATGQTAADRRAGVTIGLANVTKRYPGRQRPAVDDVTLNVPAGEIVVLVGPSGCGKTTTMKMINRLIEPSSGSVTMDGTDVLHRDPDAHRRDIGYVIQLVGLFPHLRVGQNIGVVPAVLRWPRARIAARVGELLTLVGLGHQYADRFPRQLSGGQQQRVGVARALAADPPVLLMDEPFGSTDPITRARLQDEFLRLQRIARKTIVFVTHDFDEALKMGDRIAVLRPGSVIAQYDTPANILAAPADDYVASFIGSGGRIKRLALMPATEADLGPADGSVTDAALPTVPEDASLRDALDTMVATASTAVTVPGHGTLDVAALGAALRTGTPPPAPAKLAEPTEDATPNRTQGPQHRKAATRWRWGMLVRPVGLAIVLLVLYLVVSAHQADSIEARYLNAHELAGELGQHVLLSLVCTAVTLVIAVPLGILLTRPSTRWLRPVGLGLGNLGQAIPSIGLVVLLALVISTGPVTAAIALIVYATLPVLRNTIVGLEGVDPTVTEAARGMGMSRLAVLRRIELPLAVPVILAGIRTALVLTVASAVLATFVGAGGLGEGLVVGIGLNRPLLSLTYGIVVAALALLTDWLGMLAEELLGPRDARESTR